MRWSEQELADYLAKPRASAAANRTGVSAPPLAAPTVKQPLQALGRLPTGTMNKTEARYAQHLEQLMRAGEILWWRFEGVKLRLAGNTFLTVDFAVMRADGLLEMREVKGFMRDDAAVKLKVAAAMYPLKFILVREVKGGQWSHTEV